MMRISSLLLAALALTGAVWAQPCNQHGNAGYTQGYQVQVPYGYYYCNQHSQYCNHPQYNYTTQSGFGLTSNSANSGWYSNGSCNNNNNSAWNNNNHNNWNNVWPNKRYQIQERRQRHHQHCNH